MADSQSDVQTAIYTVLQADSALGALVADRIYDLVPEDTEFPYVQIGNATGEPFEDKSKDGTAQDIQIHTWSRARGYKEAKDVMAAVRAALHRVDLTVSNHDLAWIRFTFSDIFRDADGLTSHGIQSFQVVTQPS